MASALDRLLSLRDAEDRYDIPPDELLPVQLEAAQARLESRLPEIPLLANRAQSAGIATIAGPSDLVPLLFAHNTYKSYSEPWLTEGRWDRMAKWLQTVSIYQGGNLAVPEQATVDGWLEGLEAGGCFVACSSGTTGKPAMLVSTEADLDFTARCNVSSFQWATGIAPGRDRKLFGLGPPVKNSRNVRIRQQMIDAYGTETEEPYQLPVPPITVGSVIDMIMLRRRVVEGSARASEVARYESLSSQRQATLDTAEADAVEALLKWREHKLLLIGFLPTLYSLATKVLAQGFTGRDYRGENAVLTGGGLKGAQVPADFREVTLGTFNVAEEHVFHLYSMQEINTPFPRCRSGRYHVAPWVIALPLDRSGERLLPTDEGEVEARAAFFDLSLDGRWGGVISGDQVRIDFRPCACGHEGPTIGSDIVRFADLEGGDKISCAGTIDAYVRGEA